MTDQEMNVAIAVAVGWKCSCCHQGPPDCHGCDYKYLPEGILPGYTTDLNAVHEAEKTLTDEEYSEWSYLLTQIRNDSCEECCRCRSSTARQRAEAFLKVKGLWK